MTEIDNDKLLRDFFTENRQEIADRGFSRRVMHHLPDRSNRLDLLLFNTRIALLVREKL